MKATMTVLILSAALLAAAMLFPPAWVAPGSRPQPEVAQPLGELVCPPDHRIASLLRRKADKEEAVRRLLVGDLKLLEAAECFRRLNASPPGLEDVSWKLQPGVDDGEGLCDQVVVWVFVELTRTRPPSEVEARIAVLSPEFQDHVARHGRVDLPPAEAE